MSCPSEYTCSLYCDGELAPAEAQALELHLEGCRACRAQVAALGGEAALLREVLHDRVHAPATRAAHGSDLLLECGTALGGAALAADVAARLLAPVLPRGMDWLDPLDWIGGRLMFDALVFAQQLLGALVAQCLELGVALSVLVLLGLLATSLRRVVPAAAALAFGAALLAPGTASALELRSGEEPVRIAAGETVAGTLVVAGESLVVEGEIDGDLIAFVGRLELGRPAVGVG